MSDDNVQENQEIDPSQEEQVDESAPESVESELVDENDPHSVKKRLNSQAKKHRREMQELRAQLDQLQSHFSNVQTPQNSQQEYLDQVNMQGNYSQPQTMEEYVKRGIQSAMQAEQERKRQAEQQEKAAYIQQQYKRMNDNFDKTAEKYDDFDDVVRGDNVPFTEAIRDALLLHDSPGEIAYKLAKDPKRLSELSRLHPVDQAREVNRIAAAMISGKGDNALTSKNPDTMIGNIKARPSSTSTPSTAAEMAAMMRSGNWK